MRFIYSVGALLLACVCMSSLVSAAGPAAYGYGYGYGGASDLNLDLGAGSSAQYQLPLQQSWTTTTTQLPVMQQATYAVQLPSTPLAMPVTNGFGASAYPTISAAFANVQKMRSTQLPTTVASPIMQAPIQQTLPVQQNALLGVRSQPISTTVVNAPITEATQFRTNQPIVQQQQAISQPAQSPLIDTTVAAPVMAEKVVNPQYIQQPIIRPHHLTQEVIQQQLIEQPILRQHLVEQPVIRQIVNQPYIQPMIKETTEVKNHITQQPIIQPRYVDQTIIQPKLQEQVIQNAPIQQAPTMYSKSHAAEVPVAPATQVVPGYGLASTAQYQY